MIASFLLVNGSDSLRLEDTRIVAAQSSIGSAFVRTEVDIVLVGSCIFVREEKCKYSFLHSCISDEVEGDILTSM